MAMAKILIIDADRYIRELFSLELSEQGHEVITASSYHNLAERVEKSQPDLVILDIMPRESDCLEALQEIRRRHAGLPVIICSVYDSTEYDAGDADYFVIKSYNLMELKRKIQWAMSQEILLSDHAAV